MTTAACRAPVRLARPRLTTPSAFTLLVLALAAAVYFRPQGDLDFAWQIRAGERILQTGQFQPPDAFSYTIADQHLPDHEWLYEVGLYLLWSWSGHGGLKLLRVLLVAAPLVLVERRLRREGVGWHGRALALFAAFATLHPVWNLRPMAMTTLGLLLVVGWLHDHAVGRRPLPWTFPLVLLLWANLHPGVILGQAIVVGAIAWEWLNRWVRWNSPLDLAALHRLTVVGGLGLMATLVCPDPWDRLVYTFRTNLANPVWKHFEEMRPLPSVVAEPPHLFAVAYVLAALVAIAVAAQPRRYRLWEVGVLLGLAVLANSAVRSLQDWFLTMLALGVPHLAELRRTMTLHLREEPWERRPRGFWAGLRKAVFRAERSCKHVLASTWGRLQLGWCAAALGLLTGLSLLPEVGRAMPVPEQASWPTRALDWAEAAEVGGNFFGPPDYGSYVGWRLNERGRAYIDTRGFFFPPGLLQDSLLLPAMAPDWRTRLDRVLRAGTDYFILETTGRRGALWQALQAAGATPLYRDERTVILTAAEVRRTLGSPCAE